MLTRPRHALKHMPKLAASWLDLALPLLKNTDSIYVTDYGFCYQLCHLNSQITNVIPQPNLAFADNNYFEIWLQAGYIYELRNQRFIDMSESARIYRFRS